MIRINLLPVRAARKKESVRMQLTVAALVTALVVIASLAVHFSISGQASAMADDIARGNQEINELKKKIGELSKIKEQKRIVEEKLGTINALEAARSGPARMFRMISSAIPERAWLASLKEEGGVIALKGYAVSDEVVADFMRGLEKYSAELGRVELEVAQRGVEKETNTDLVGFTIRLEKEKPAAQQDKAKAPAQPQKGAGK